MTNALPHERALLDQVAAGDEHAFTELFEHYCHALGEYLFRLTRSRETAEEVVQDVFLKIWIAREALAEVRDFRSYLFIASKHQALNALKKAAREAVNFGRFAHDTQQQVDGAGEDAELQAIEGQYYSLLDAAIAQLPQQQQRAFLLSRQERKQYAEIAELMGISKESVKKYLQHATRSVSDYVRAHMDPALVALLLMASLPELAEKF